MNKIKWAIDYFTFLLLFPIQDFLGGHSSDVTKADFTTSIKKAAVKGTPEYNELYFFFLKNGPNPTSFCLFSFFSHDKYSTNTINEKA